jgi:hypothetical protein
MHLREMNEHVTYLQQLREDDGPVALINEFNISPENTDHFITVWADDAAFMKRQPGFISTQLHRGTAGSSTFVNVAIWEISTCVRGGVPLSGVPAPRPALP